MQPAKILVADDEQNLRRVLVALLRREGHDVVQAASGLEAIERLAVGVVDLVVLDLNMPDLHGLEVLRFVRTHPSLSDLPVVILTTRDDAESRRAALREGATLYLTKPFSPETLVPEVSRLLVPA